MLAGGQPIRDHWQVLARRDLEQDRIRTRRTWLRGRKTGRDALLLSFAAAGQPLDDSLAVGTETDADLVFYPGAVPLRAVVLARHDDSDGGASGGAPLDAGPPDGGTIAGLLGGYAAALAADPWLDSWPAVLEIIPVRAPPPPSAARTAAACRCTPARATAGRCSRSPAAGR